MQGIDLNIFFNKPERSLDLYEKLNEKVYLKSQIDVVYTDYINWERSGILLTNSDKEKGTQNKISRKDYLWCKLIEQLRRFNVSINDISILKSEWIDVNYFPEIIKILKTNKSVKEKVVELIGTDEEQFKELNNLHELPHIDAFDTFLVHTIIERKQFQLDFFYEDGNIQFLPRNINVYSELKSEDFSALNNYYNNHYVSISISKLIEAITNTSYKSKDEFVNQILTREEHKLLFEIRRNLNSIKELRVKYKKGEINLIEIDKWKKVQLETKVLDLFNSKDYKNLELKIEKGEVRAVIETNKIKI